MTRAKGEIDADIERLRDWLCKQPHLPNSVDIELLSAYVHGTKGLEIAKQKLDSYFTSKSKYPHLFEFPARDAMDGAFQEASEAVKIFFLPKMTKDRYLVLMITFDKETSAFNHDQYVVRLMMMLELAMFRWPEMNGIILIGDVGGMDYSILAKLTPTTAAFFVHWFQSTVPMKLKRAIIISTPKFFDMVINKVFKPALSNKLFERITLTSEGKEILKNHVPEELLPSDFGGSEITSDELNDYWLEELVKNREWFLKASKQLVDETKRPGDRPDSFSIDGTFRSLTID